MTRAANQYSCLTYTEWVETLYIGTGRTAILLLLHDRNYNRTMSILVRHAFSLATIPISYSHDRYFLYSFHSYTVFSVSDWSPHR